MILDDILAHKLDEVSERKRATSIATLRERPLYQEPRRGFRPRCAAAPPAVIAELKRASPSRGVIRSHYDPPAHARAYESAGATALSVLTDERFFQGHLDHLVAVRGASACRASARTSWWTRIKSTRRARSRRCRAR